MMKKRYSSEQIIRALKENEAGAKVEDICRRLGISVGTFYKRLGELEAGNNKLKKLLAEKLLENEAMK